MALGKHECVRPVFPFSAIVCNDAAKEALVCALTSPDINSVLICGPKGTGKSVLARSVSSIAGRKIVTLPLNATEDRIFGSIDLEKAMSEGKRRSSLSMLAEADKNILLVENLNIFPEYLTYQIMNAAEFRSNVVEREGISETYDCRFLLIATMNPDEGAMSEHLLDRFDICVFTSNIEDEDQREEIVRRRFLFEKDPLALMKEYSGKDSDTAELIRTAREKARFTRVPDGYCGAISNVCTELNVCGHRGDISVMNASCALAALDGRETANLDDLKKAAAMCLEHRRNDIPQDQEPPEPPENDDRDDEPEDDNDQNNDEDPPQDQEPPEPPEPPEDDDREQMPPPPMPDVDANEEVFEVGDAFRVIDYMPKNDGLKNKGRSGKHTESMSDDKTGRCIGYQIPKGRIEDVALCASICAAAPYQVIRDHSDLAIVMSKDDLREKVREKKRGNEILFLVDGSGSIGAQKRMVAVKGAILSMLKDAYQKRDTIGMAVFRTDHAEEVLPLTKSVLRAYKVLADIPTGGKTPLTHGLIKGYEILSKNSSANSRSVMVILSDGRCNVAYTPGVKPLDEMLSTARSLADKGMEFIVIDTETGRLRFGLALELCRALDGTYLCLEDLNAEYIASSVRSAMNKMN